MTEPVRDLWAPREGEVVNDRWRLDRRASTGTSVETWDGVDLQLERRIALQIIRHAELDDAEAQRSFQRRVTLMAKVEHPNVMRIFDVVVTNGHAVSVCEWIDGVVLEDALDAGLRGWTAAACVGVQLAAGAGALHGHDLVHRGVTPANVMLTEQGIAKITGGGRVRYLFSDSTLTDRDMLLAKMGYIAPERTAGGSRDPSVDVYAIGVILWEITTGERVLDRVQEDPGPVVLPRPSEAAADVPAEFDDVVFAATRPDPAARPADAVDLYERLTPLVPSRPAEVLRGILEADA